VREARFQVYDEIRARNRDKRPQEVEADVAEAVAAVRKQVVPFHGPVTVGATPQPSPQAPGAAPPDADSGALDRLYHVLHTRFDQEELRTLCFKLGVNYDDLRGEGHSAKARELVLYMSRRMGGLERLRAVIQAERPGAPLLCKTC
jgi:hypothetical protein